MTVKPVSSISAPGSDGRRFAAALIAGLVLWTGLIAGLAYLLYTRTYWLRESGEANLREWLDESRVFRKALPQLIADYVELRDKYQTAQDDGLAVYKRKEIAE